MERGSSKKLTVPLLEGNYDEKPSVKIAKGRKRDTKSRKDMYQQRAQSSDQYDKLVTTKKYDAAKMKFKVAKKAHEKKPEKIYLQGRTLSAFTDDEKSKNVNKIVSAEYYLYTHFFGEDLHDEDDDYEGSEMAEIHHRGDFSRSSFIGDIGVNVQGHVKTLGPLQTFFTLMKGFVGIAMLLFPNGYYNAGWLFGTVTILVISLLVIICSNLLLTVSEEYPGTFSSLGERSLGKPGKIFCDIALGLTQTGFVCMHIVFISQNVNGILDANFGFTINKWVIGGICLGIYAPLTWVRRIQYFAKYHIFADISVICALIVILFYAFVNYEGNEVQPINKDSYMVFVGTCVFAFEGVGIVLPVKDTTRNPKQYRFILTLIMTIVAFLLIAFGLTNYMAYSNEELINAKLITRLLPSNSPIVQI